MSSPTICVISIPLRVPTPLSLQVALAISPYVLNVLCISIRAYELVWKPWHIIERLEDQGLKGPHWQRT